MWNRSIPADEQIDALLAGHLGRLLDRHRCSLDTLRRRWSVSVDDIVSRAQQHGVASFVRDASPGDGIHLVRAPDGYQVTVVDHGCQLFEQRFDALDAALGYWVTARLDAARLPHHAGR